jgi:hypothetical protein
VRKTGIATALLALLVSTACAPRSRPVAVDASPADREALLGSWRGSYTIEGQRGGTISFALLSRGDEAHGDVLMVPKGLPEPYGRLTPDGRPPAGGPAVASEVLTIRFVRAAQGSVKGMLAPYWDPDRACVARATFDGTLVPGSLSGTFVSTCEGAAPTYTGRWTMRRVG